MSNIHVLYIKCIDFYQADLNKVEKQRRERGGKREVGAREADTELWLFKLTNIALYTWRFTIISSLCFFNQEQFILM